MDHLRKTIRDAGFTPKEVKITALGSVSIKKELPEFATGPAENYVLVFNDSSRKKIDQIRLANGKTVVLKGIISGESELQDRIQLIDFEPVK
jgi:hypothetical protein